MRTAYLPLLAATALSTLAFTSHAAYAQEQDSAASTDNMMEEMMVTARRREETLLEVPIAVSSFDGAELERINTETIIDVAKFSPNVTLEVSRGTNTTLTAFIRGVGQQDPVAGFEAGVGIYIDDVYLNRPQAAVLDIFEVERIEVLRGPQGTLYGRNTIGGAIKYVTKRLDQDLSFKVRGVYGTFNQADLVVSANVPVTETFVIGGSFATLNRDGFGENLTLGIDNYDKEVLSGRLQVEWAPSEDLYFRVVGDYTDDSSNARQGGRLIPGLLSGAPVLSNVFDTRAGLDVVPQEVNAGGVSFTAEWTPSEELMIKSIFAYREDDQTTPIDFDSLPAPDLDVPAIYENQQFSEELQILYQNDWLSGLLGFYYLSADALTAFDVLLDTTGQFIGLPGLNAQTFGDVDTETWAIFGDFTIDLTETLSVSYGGRFTSDERTSQVLRTTFIGGFTDLFDPNSTAVPIATTSDFFGSETFEDYTHRASIQWQPVDNHNVYFSYSEGFKGGGFDPRGQTTAAPDLDGDGDIDADDEFEFLRFAPERVDTFELGWKGSLFDGRVTFRMAGFLSNYTDVQIPGSVGVDTTGDGVNDSFIGITSNAADADINGFEFEGSALLTENLTGRDDTVTLYGSLGLLDAEFNTFIDAFGVDVADERVFQNTPDTTFSVTLDYRTPFSFGGIDGSLAIINSVAYRSLASQFEIPSPELDQPAFALWDMSIVFDTEDGKYQVGAHFKNITDQEYIVAGYNFVAPDGAGGFIPTLGLEGTLTGFYGNPRQVNISFQAKF